ncbi:MAG: hypothetical protein RJA22_956 [Verrucomicrobiota bacterium]|jgi:hypothetical protein
MRIADLFHPASRLATLLLASITALQAAPPANDNRFDATLISGVTGRVVVNNAEATKEPGEPNHASNAGGKSVWFVFTPPNAMNVRFDTCGTDFDTVMALYSGTNVTAGAVNDNYSSSWYQAGHGGRTQSRLNVNLLAGTTYYIAVDGFNSGTGALSGPIVFNWNLTNGAPANDNFANATELTGTSGGYSGRNLHATKETGEGNHAANAGGRSIWYKWTPAVSGQAAVDMQGSSFDGLLGVYAGPDIANLTELGSSDDLVNNWFFNGRVTFDAVAGTTYYIAVDGYNGGTAASSGSVVLNYNLSPSAPPNDNFDNAIAITGSLGSITGDSLSATKEAGEPAHGEDTGGNSVWYAWTAPADGMVTFNNFGPWWDSLLGVYTGTNLNSLTLVGQNDDIIGGLIQISRVSFLATSGTVYRIAVDGFAADYGPFSLNWDQAVGALTNDLVSQAATLEGRSGSVTNSNANAVWETVEPAPNIVGTTLFGLTLGGKSLWYKWTANSIRPVTFDTLGTAINTSLVLATVTNGIPTVIAYSDDISSNNVPVSAQSRITLSNVVVGTTYYIQVDGAFYGIPRQAPNGNIVLNYSQPGGIPTNDNYAGAIVLSGNSGLTNGNTIDATVEPSEPEHAAISPSSSVWYRWTAPSTGWVTFDTLTNATADTVLAVYTGNSLDSLVEVVSNDDASPGIVAQSRATFLATQGTTYSIVVDTKGGISAQGLFTLRWRPTITLAARRETTGNLTLILTTAAPGFYQLQDSPSLTNPAWVTFDSLNISAEAGGTINYDAGVLPSSSNRYYRSILQ